MNTLTARPEWFWELTDSTGRPVRFGASWLRKAVIPKGNNRNPYGAWPGTLVVAEIAHPQDSQRIVYFVRLNEWGYPRQHFRQSLVVDAESLGPTYRRGRKIGRQDRRAFRAAVRAAREHWRALNANQATVEPSWLDRLLRRPLTSVGRVILESETEIVPLTGKRGEPAGFRCPEYAREAIIYPLAPNVIAPTDLGPGRIVIAYGRIAAGYQSVMRMPYWAQRAWYQDLTIGDAKTYFDGLSPPIGNVVEYIYHSSNSPHPGLESRQFDDASTLRPIDNMADLMVRKKQLIGEYGAK